MFKKLIPILIIALLGILDFALISFAWQNPTQAPPGGNLALPWTKSGTNVYLSNTSDNIGIGTINPTIKLAIGDTDTGIQWISDGNLGIYTNNAERIRINSSGNVGIGTTTPITGLTLWGPNSFEGISLYNTYDSLTTGLYSLVSSGTAIQFRRNTAAAGNFSTFTTPLTIDSTDYVGIGVTAPTYRLQLPNTANVAGKGQANAWVTYSDIRYKTNIRPISNALDKINQLEGVYFNWKSDGVQEIGLVAQQVEPIIPEVVTTDSEGYKSIDYGRLTSLLIEGIKEQQIQIESQGQQINELKTQLNNLQQIVKTNNQ